MFKCVDLQTILKTRFWEKNCVRTQNDVDVVLDIHFKKSELRGLLGLKYVDMIVFFVCL